MFVHPRGCTCSPENEYDGKQLVEFPHWPTEGSRLPHSSVIDSVLSRIDRVIGVQRHAEEVKPKVHGVSPLSLGGAENSDHPKLDPLVSGFHVDINARPYRYATAILYLTSTSDASGATIFPCANGNLPAIEAATSLLASGVYHTDHALADSSLRKKGETPLEETNSDKSLFVEPIEGRLCVFLLATTTGYVILHLGTVQVL